MTNRILIGRHNPHSNLPRDALAPWPAGGDGDRLVELLRLVAPRFTVDDYLETFTRYVLWEGQDFPEGPGRRSLLERNGRKLFRKCIATPSAVGILGEIAWACVVNRTPPEWFTSHVIRESVFWYLPHPSGLNRIYNTRENRERAGRALLEIARWNPTPILRLV